MRANVIPVCDCEWWSEGSTNVTYGLRPTAPRCQFLATQTPLVSEKLGSSFAAFDDFSQNHRFVVLFIPRTVDERNGAFFALLLE